MNKKYAILPMLHIAKVEFTAIAIAQDPDVARSQGIPLDNIRHHQMTDFHPSQIL